MNEHPALRFLFSLWPFVVRALAVAIGAFAVSWGVTGEPGIIAAMSGAVLGSLVGHLLARTRLRLPLIVLGFAGLSAGLWTLTSLAAEGTWIPRALGPTGALVAFSVLRFGSVSLGLVSCLRVIAARKPNFVAVELVGLAATIVAAFSAHREGVLSRPLWLADWAWRHGVNPQSIFLALGFAAAGMLSVVLLAEMKSREIALLDPRAGRHRLARLPRGEHRRPAEARSAAPGGHPHHRRARRSPRRPERRRREPARRRERRRRRRRGRRRGGGWRRGRGRRRRRRRWASRGRHRRRRPPRRAHEGPPAARLGLPDA